MSEQLKVGIVGAAGYTGAELIRCIHGHPRLELRWVAARENAGKALADALPALRGVAGIGDLMLQSFDPAKASELRGLLDVVFCALPHGASSEAVKALYQAGITVVDLSADF